MSSGKVGCPVAHGFVHGILQGAATAGNGHNLCTVKFHGSNVGLLTTNVHFAHVNDTFKTELGASGCSGEAVLTCAGFCDNAGLAHLLCQEALTDGVVDLVGAGVGETFKLDVDLSAAQKFCSGGGKVQRSFAANVVALDHMQFFQEFRILDVLVECFFKIVQRATDDFGYVLAAELVEKAVV